MSTSTVGSVRMFNYIGRFAHFLHIHNHHISSLIFFSFFSYQHIVGGVCLRYLAHGIDYKFLCKTPLVAAGPWTRGTFDEWVLVSTVKIPVALVVGHSLVVKNSQQAEAEGCHAALTPGLCERWSPDIISRVGGERYILQKWMIQGWRCPI